MKAKIKPDKKDQRFLLPPSQRSVIHTITFRASAKRACSWNESTTHQTSLTTGISDNRQNCFCIVSSRTDGVVAITHLVNYYSDITADQFHLLVKTKCAGAYNGSSAKLQQQSCLPANGMNFHPLKCRVIHGGPQL